MEGPATLRATRPAPRVRRAGTLLVTALVALAAAVVLALPRIPQPAEYHAFADRRALLGIPNALDVLSNAGFALVGAWGLLAARRRTRSAASWAEQAPWLVLALGVLAIAPGSAWYHLAPSNATLLWDRLPMAAAFMAMLAALVGERVGAEVGRRLLAPLVVAGLASVVYWYASELRGAGDLRPYIAVQAVPLAAIPLLLALFPGPAASDRAWIVALALYGAAKALEVGDAPVLQALGVSGHTLKHLVAAASVAWLVRMRWRSGAAADPGARGADAAA